MSRRAVIGECCVGAAVLAALSCARFGYESLPDGVFDPVPSDIDVTHGGDVGGSGGASDGGTVSGGGTAQSDAAASGGGAGSSSGTLAGCAPAVPTATWAFASDTQAWQLEADPGAAGTLSWSAVIGDPAPGALELDATIADGRDNIRLQLDQSQGDFTGKVIYARVFLEAGSGVSAKVFVQTGAGMAWADGDEVYLEAQQWNCVSFDLQAPAVSTPGFDRTAVRRIGVLFFGDASPRLYVDQIAY